MFYVGTVLELPDVVAYEETHQAAYDALIAIITDLKKAADDHGRPFPVPRPRVSEYSGRITLRLPQHLHRKVAMQAEEEDISINQLVAAAIAESIGKRASPKLIISALNITTVATSGAENLLLPDMLDTFWKHPQLTTIPQARTPEHA